MKTTNQPRFSASAFEAVPLIGIVRNIDLSLIQQILPVFAEAGLSTIEFTMNSPGAASAIRWASEEYGTRLNIGAGTVCSMSDLDQALDAGAQFIVTPIVQTDVITSCVRQSVPVFPGAFTPSEIATAWGLGATMVKVFPASTLGPEYFKSVLAPLSKVKLLATGGITLNEVDAYAAAGVKGFGIGSPLFLPEYITGRRWSDLSAHFKKFRLQIVSLLTTHH